MEPSPHEPVVDPHDRQLAAVDPAQMTGRTQRDEVPPVVGASVLSLMQVVRVHPQRSATAARVLAGVEVLFDDPPRAVDPR